MEEMTLCVGALAVALVLLLRPRYGLLVYLITILCYPEYLRIILFGFTISAGRIVVTALLIRCLLETKLTRNFRWSTLDTLIITADAVYMLALSCAIGDPSVAIKYRSGAMLDTTFAYFSARLIITNSDQLISLVKGATIVLIIMAALGIFEAATTKSPYNGLLKYRFYAERILESYGRKFTDQEVMVAHGHEERLGFFRAQGPHSHPIIFGASFALFLPLVWKLLYHTRWRSLRTPVCGAIVVGGASSLSSTPFTGLLVALAGLAFERLERWGKQLFVLFILSCFFLEFYTERPHFYYVLLSRLSINAGTGYERGRLIDAALKHLPEYWLTGYGRDPGWGKEVSGMDYTDVCIHYIALAVMYGVFGLLAYLAIVFKLLFSLWRKYRRSVEAIDRNICWALIVTIAVTLTLDLGVAPSGALPALYSIIFGIGGSLIAADARQPKAATAPHAELMDWRAAEGIKDYE
jgi:hypothetical protein